MPLRSDSPRRAGAFLRGTGLVLASGALVLCAACTTAEEPTPTLGGAVTLDQGATASPDVTAGTTVPGSTTAGDAKAGGDADDQAEGAGDGADGGADGGDASNDGGDDASGDTKVGGPWLKRAATACTEVAADSKRPNGASDGVELLTWHQNVTYLLASRLSALPDPPKLGTDLVQALQQVGNRSEALVTLLSAKPVDQDARQATDAERTAAIGRAAALTARLGLTPCTTLVAGG